MKKILNKKSFKFLILIIIVVISICIVNNFKILERIANVRLKQENENNIENPLISYQVYDNSMENKIKTLITINDNDGIEYIEYPDETKLYGNDKKILAIDYIMNKNENYTFKIKTHSSTEVQEKTICANDEFVNNNGVSISKINNETGYKIIDIENKIELDGYKTYYQIGKNGKWTEENGRITLVDYDLITNDLINDDNTITINAKIENKNTKEVVTTSKNYEVNNNLTTNSYEAESLFDLMEKNELTTGVYNVKVKDEEYNLKIYSFDENLNISADTTLGTEEDVATASEYAKNMIVLKVNGDLTIDEGAKLTTYTSKNGYGGPKGMMIYCTGTITNKGEISMTARGAKAEGQNVYLYKNSDETYEYIPAVGATGGEKVYSIDYVYSSSGESKTPVNGNDGSNGEGRATGGGGSGRSQS